MDSTLLTVFVGITALAFIFQCIAFVFLARSLRQLAARLEEIRSGIAKTVEPLKDRLETLVGNVNVTAEKLRTLQDNLTATSEVIHRRVVSVDRFMSETTESARLQVIRIQDAMDLACRRTEQAVNTLYRGVIMPVSEASAIINGLRAGLGILTRRAKRPAVRAGHQDEELFI